MTIFKPIDRTLEGTGIAYRLTEAGFRRVLEQEIEMDDNLDGVRFTVEDVEQHIGIPYGYARTLMVRLFNWPQDKELKDVELIVGKESDLYQTLQGAKFIKGTTSHKEDLSKLDILNYIKDSSKHIIDLSTWIKD